MSRLDYLRHRVWRLTAIRVLDAVVNEFEVLVNCQGRVNWLAHSLIVGIEVRGHDIPVADDQITEYIATGDS